LGTRNWNGIMPSNRISKEAVMEPSSSAGVQKVKEQLTALGYSNRVVEVPASTRTSAEAAAAMGCSVGQIAKSILFKTRSTEEDSAVMVVASGANRVDEKKVEALIGFPVTKADADFVRQQTGFVIGGVPPIGHAQALRILIDEDLFQYELIWAAAGSPHAVFQLTPAQLVEMTAGTVANIRAD
jgi:prolyl-tRNA editing enzyme YbaK/EbsC (Cys-tRNA(Pro) deacylase)